MNNAPKRKCLLPSVAIAAALALIGLGFVGCGQKSEEKRLQPALDSILAEDLAKDTQILASDEFEGRGPASEGEVRTINFLRDEFQKVGLKPGKALPPSSSSMRPSPPPIPGESSRTAGRGRSST